MADDTLTQTAPTAPRNVLGLSMTQLVGGSLAASTAAALGGRLGLAGTLIGAAAASVVSAVAAAVYTHSLRRTREFIRPTRVGPAPVHDPGDPADPPLEVMAPAPRTLRLDLGGLGMRRLVTGALAVFAAAAVVVTGVELATGRSLDGDGGTTAAQVVSGSGRSPADVPAVTPTSTGTVTTSTSPSPTTSVPTVTATITVTTGPTPVSTTAPSATSSSTDSPTSAATTAPATP